MSGKNAKKFRRANNALSTDKSIVGRLGGDIRESSEKLNALYQEFSTKIVKIMEQRFEQERIQGKKLSKKEWVEKYQPMVYNECDKYWELYGRTYYEELDKKYGSDLCYLFTAWFYIRWFNEKGLNKPNEPLELHIQEKKDVLCGIIFGSNTSNIYGEMFIEGDNKRWEVIPSDNSIRKKPAFSCIYVDSLIESFANPIGLEK